MAAELNPSASTILGRYLMEGETLLWAEQSRFDWKDEVRRHLPLLGIILVLFAFVLLNLLSQEERSTSPAPIPASPQSQEGEPPIQSPHRTPLIAILFGAAFFSVFVGLWCFFMFRAFGGQRLLNLFSRSKTYYGLTERRLILVTGRKELRVLSYHLRTLQDLRLHELPDGTGTIQLSSKTSPENPFQKEEIPSTSLRSVPQSAQVFGLICQTQHRLLSR